MKGLRKYLTPFAPDQSGAVSFLYEAGGLIVIIDAGGCTGNICGFDEPRWEKQRSAIFSAGLRDMDAIMGRDDRLIEKIEKAMKKIDAPFVALIGTPVPAVIGTDFNGIAHLLETKLKKPVITCPTSGVGLYDRGIEMANLAMVKTFGDDQKTNQDIGVLGFTPLDFGNLSKNPAYNYYHSVKECQSAGALKKNYVANVAGLKAAQYLKRKYGIPYEVGYPDDIYPDISGNAVLAVTPQAIGLDLRKKASGSLTIASYFMMKKAYRAEDDVLLKEEDDLTDFVNSHHFDTIVADDCYKELVPDFAGRWITLPHFAASGSDEK